MASFVGRTVDGDRVRVNMDAGAIVVVRAGVEIASGFPTVDGDLWTWPTATLRSISEVRTSELVWSEVDGVRTDGGTLVASKATAVIAGAVMLLPSTTQSPAGVHRLSGFSPEWAAVEWLVKRTKQGCGC